MTGELFRRSIIAVAILHAFVLEPANAYEIATHAALSDRAALQSSAPQWLANVGIATIDDLLSGPSALGPIKRSVRGWIAEGSQREDDPPYFINHFYNPLNAAGLSLPPGLPSLTWGLEKDGPIAFQNYSFKDARTYLMSGLTASAEADRQSNLALTFRTLGDVIHLIQDLAQPQHTRNDAHPFHPYYERYVDQLRQQRQLATAVYPSVYPDIDPSAFNKPDNFWHTGATSRDGVATGIGMADYSNRGFVTTGTNFRGTATMIQPDPNFPMPDGTLASIERIAITDPSLLGPVGPDQPLSGELWFIRTPVRDTYRTETREIRTSTWSIYGDDLAQLPDPLMRYSQNRFNFIDMQGLLIPRAVGYSAGLINYFFRGQIDVKLPQDGVYAIVDHTAQASRDNGCDTPCGFRKVKLQLQNSSPVGEDMAAGTLRMVAKFHLNNCYQADLSGEFGAANYTGRGCRSVEESIVVSDVKAVSAVERTFVELTFMFSAPIPINATDLYLQVVFQGKLGTEDGALAVATVDVREPTFLTFGNHNDFQAVYNLDGTFARTDAYRDAGAFSLSLELRFDRARATPTAVSGQLDPGDYHRVAVLIDKDYVDYWLAERYASDQNFFTQEWVPPATVNQTYSTGQTINYPAYVTLRHTTATDWAYTANAPGSAIYWEPGFICVDGSITCVPVDRTVDAVARRYPPFRQPVPKPMAVDF